MIWICYAANHLLIVIFFQFLSSQIFFSFSFHWAFLQLNCCFQPIFEFNQTLQDWWLLKICKHWKVLSFASFKIQNYKNKKIIKICFGNINFYYLNNLEYYKKWILIFVASICFLSSKYKIESPVSYIKSYFKFYYFFLIFKLMLTQNFKIKIIYIFIFW